VSTFRAISNYQIEDVVIWGHAENGVYSSKSVLQTGPGSGD